MVNVTWLQAYEWILNCLIWNVLVRLSHSYPVNHCTRIRGVDKRFNGEKDMKSSHVLAYWWGPNACLHLPKISVYTKTPSPTTGRIKECQHFNEGESIIDARDSRSSRKSPSRNRPRSTSLPTMVVCFRHLKWSLSTVSGRATPRSQSPSYHQYDHHRRSVNCKH